MNDLETQRLAAAIHALRPDWPTQSLRTLIAAKLAGHAFRDLALALVYVATDPDTRTPARVAEPGPWWEPARIANGEITPTPPNVADVLDRRGPPAPPNDDYRQARAALRRETA